MKRAGVLYATREGHTERIAGHIAQKLAGIGLEADLKNLKAGGVRLAGYDGVILAASVHAGSHEPEMIDFVKGHRAELDRIPAAFLSVTLSEAGAERADTTPDEHARFAADVQQMMDKFFEETGWHASRAKPVAGALLYTKYNVFIRFIMKRIARQAHADTDTSRDYEYTDWAALDRFVEEFAEEIAGPR